MSGEGSSAPTASTQALAPAARSAPAVRRDGALAIGAAVIGAVALGALAIGAVAIGKLALGQLAVGRARLRRGQVDDLQSRSLTVDEAAHRPVIGAAVELAEGMLRN